MVLGIWAKYREMGLAEISTLVGMDELGGRTCVWAISLYESMTITFPLAVM